MKKATIYDIAEAAGCSAMTVTRAFREGSSISPATKERIMREAERLGFTPSVAASRLSKPETIISAALFDVVPELTKQQMQGFHEVEEELRNMKVRLSLHVFSDREELPHVLDEIEGEEPGGVILMSDEMTDGAKEKLEAMQRRGVKLAVAACPHNDLQPDVCVVVDAETSGRIAAQLLGGIGQCCVFIGNAETSLHRKALESFKAVSEKYGTQLGCVYDTREDPALSQALVLQMLEHGVPAGIYISTANSRMILTELKKRDLTGRMRIVCTDVLQHTGAALNNGDIYATLFSDPPYQVKTACRELCRMITTGSEDRTSCTIRPQIVLSSNIEKYTQYY